MGCVCVCVRVFVFLCFCVSVLNIPPSRPLLTFFHRRRYLTHLIISLQFFGSPTPGLSVFLLQATSHTTSFSMTSCCSRMNMLHHYLRSSRDNKINNKQQIWFQLSGCECNDLILN